MTGVKAYISRAVMLSFGPVSLLPLKTKMGNGFFFFLIEIPFLFHFYNSQGVSEVGVVMEKWTGCGGREGQIGVDSELLKC